MYFLIPVKVHMLNTSGTDVKGSKSYANESLMGAIQAFHKMSTNLI